MFWIHLHYYLLEQGEKVSMEKFKTILSCDLGNESILLYNYCYDHEIVIGIVCNKVEKVVKTEVLNVLLLHE